MKKIIKQGFERLEGVRREIVTRALAVFIISLIIFIALSLVLAPTEDLLALSVYWQLAILEFLRIFALTLAAGSFIAWIIRPEKEHQEIEKISSEVAAMSAIETIIASSQARQIIAQSKFDHDRLIDLRIALTEAITETEYNDQSKERFDFALSKLDHNLTGSHAENITVNTTYTGRIKNGISYIEVNRKTTYTLRSTSEKEEVVPMVYNNTGEAIAGLNEKDHEITIVKMEYTQDNGNTILTKVSPGKIIEAKVNEKHRSNYEKLGKFTLKGKDTCVYNDEIILAIPYFDSVSQEWGTPRNGTTFTYTYDNLKYGLQLALAGCTKDCTDKKGELCLDHCNNDKHVIQNNNSSSRIEIRNWAHTDYNVRGIWNTDSAD